MHQIQTKAHWQPLAWKWVVEGKTPPAGPLGGVTGWRRWPFHAGEAETCGSLAPPLGSLSGPILSQPRRPRGTVRWAVGDACKGTGEAAGHHRRQRTYSAAWQVSGGSGTPVSQGKIGGGRKKLQAPALISALQIYCSFSKPPKSSAGLSSLNHPYTCFIYSELSKPNIFPLFPSPYPPGSLFANTEPSIESWMSLADSGCDYSSDEGCTIIWSFPHHVVESTSAKGRFRTSLCSHFTLPWSFG